MRAKAKISRVINIATRRQAPALATSLESGLEGELDQLADLQRRVQQAIHQALMDGDSGEAKELINLRNRICASIQQTEQAILRQLKPRTRPMLSEATSLAKLVLCSNPADHGVA